MLFLAAWHSELITMGISIRAEVVINCSPKQIEISTERMILANFRLRRHHRRIWSTPMMNRTSATLVQGMTSCLQERLRGPDVVDLWRGVEKRRCLDCGRAVWKPRPCKNSQLMVMDNYRRLQWRESLRETVTYQFQRQCKPSLRRSSSYDGQGDSY